MEEEAHLTAEKKAQLATQTMAKVWMAPHSGPAGAEKFVRAYERAYLLELRAGLVLTHEVATAQRLFAYKEKLAPEVRAYLKGLPDVEQPISLAEMHRAVRKWAEIQREGQMKPDEGNWEHEYMADLTETKSREEKQKERQAAEKAKREQAAAKSEVGSR